MKGEWNQGELASSRSCIPWKGESIQGELAILLSIAAHDPKAIINELIENPGCKLKGAGPLEFHLGCDFFCDPDGTLCFGSIKYIKKILSVYENMFNQKPKPSSSPLERNDNPELDASEEVAADAIMQYQSMIGALQWTISLGRFDICTAI